MFFYLIRDNVRVLINNERLVKELVNLCGFFLYDLEIFMGLMIDF